MVRCGLYGLLPEGMRMADLDAAGDHSGAGVECTLAAAGLVALVRAGSSANDAIAQVSSMLSDTGVAELAVGANFETLKIEEFAETACLRCNTRNPDDARLNFLLLCAGLRVSKGDLGLAWRTLGSWGGACDVTCGLAGLILGPSQPDVVREWSSPLGTSYISGAGLRVQKVPATHSEYVDRVASAFVPAPAPVVEMAVVSTAEEPPAVASEADITTPEVAAVVDEPAAPVQPALPLPDLALAKSLLQIPALSQQSGPMSFAILSDFKTPENTVEALIRYQNAGTEKVELKPLLSRAESWTVATRVPDTLLPAGEAWSQALILKPSPEAKSEVLHAEWQGSDLSVPLPAPHRWYTCGPFPNIEMEAYNRACPCEDRLNTKDRFPGRSNIPVQWTPHVCRGTIFDVEDWFVGGQGAYCIAARLKFEPGQVLTLVWSYSPGGQVTLNGNVLLRNNDQTEPIDPLRATFTTTETDTLIIRLMRHNRPASQLVVYFVDERGRVVDPEFIALES